MPKGTASRKQRPQQVNLAENCLVGFFGVGTAGFFLPALISWLFSKDQDSTPAFAETLMAASPIIAFTSPILGLILGVIYSVFQTITQNRVTKSGSNI